MQSKGYIIIRVPQGNMKIDAPIVMNNMVLFREIMQRLSLRMKCPSGHHLDEHFEFEV